MYYNITIFSQFVVAPTGYIINAMDLKIFPNTVVLLKVDHFEGFSNQSNIDELVINSTSGCNYKSYKLINKNYKLNNTVPLNYNFTFPCITMRVITRGTQCIPLRVCVNHVS